MAGPGRVGGAIDNVKAFRAGLCSSKPLPSPTRPNTTSSHPREPISALHCPRPTVSLPGKESALSGHPPTPDNSPTVNRAPGYTRHCPLQSTAWPSAALRVAHARHPAPTKLNTKTSSTAYLFLNSVHHVCGTDTPRVSVSPRFTAAYRRTNASRTSSCASNPNHPSSLDL
jgi:hypothetical protein